MEAAELAQSLDKFFGTIPKETRYHIELRTESYLAEPVFKILEKQEVGLVPSHWTWLPPLGKQFTKSGGSIFSSGGQSIVRLITTLRMSYEDSYGRAFPFDKLVEGMLNPQMIEDTVGLIREAIKREKRIAIIVNNWAGGNGPLIAEQTAKRFLDLHG